MKRKKGKHKQSKFFTIMLIPYSDAKVKRFRVRNTTVSVFCALLAGLILAAGFQQVWLLRNSGQRTVDYSAYFDGIDIEILDAAHTDGNSGSNEERFDGQIEDLELRLVQLWEKSEEIDTMRQEIIGVFDQLTAMNLPFTFDQTVPGGIVYARGGLYSGSLVDTLAEMESIIIGLDTDFAKEVSNTKNMLEFAENLEAFFTVRPTGWPVAQREVVSEFGHRIDPFTNISLQRHDGVDIETPYGAEVYATAYGVVAKAGWDDAGYGNLIIIEHGFDYSTLYAHNSTLLVSEGDEVYRGQVIAKTGNSGISIGPHCHYEVRINGVPQDPRKYLD